VLTGKPSPAEPTCGAVRGDGDHATATTAPAPLALWRQSRRAMKCEVAEGDVSEFSLKRTIVDWQGVWLHFKHFGLPCGSWSSLNAVNGGSLA